MFHAIEITQNAFQRAPSAKTIRSIVSQTNGHCFSPEWHSLIVCYVNVFCIHFILF